MIRFTWGEKINNTFHQRVFQPYSVIETDEKDQGAKEKTNPETENWYRMLKEIALRKRLQYVIRNRSVTQEEKSPLGPKLWNRGKKKLSQIQGKKLKNKFLEDKNLLWSNAVRFHKTTNGDKIYFQFANYNLEIL